MTFSPFWCLCPEYPIPSPLFGRRCWSHRHAARSGRVVSLRRDGPHWPRTLARATHHRPIWQRLCRRSCSEWPVWPIEVCRYGQALPLHPRVEDPQDEVKNPVIAQFALRSTLGHRKVRQDKCGERRFGELDGNRRRYRLCCRGAHYAMASCRVTFALLRPYLMSHTSYKM
jgi:hypothetical protein